ncbi:hypothetical protein D3C73_1035210 [compost metagenome]
MWGNKGYNLLRIVPVDTQPELFTDEPDRDQGSSVSVQRRSGENHGLVVHRGSGLIHNQLDGCPTLFDCNRLARLVPADLVAKVLRDHPEGHHDGTAHIFNRNILPCCQFLAIEKNLVVRGGSLSMLRQHQYKEHQQQCKSKFLHSSPLRI